MRKLFTMAAVGVALALGAATAGEPLKSGPQVGEELAGPFHPLNINGPSAGEKSCLYCRFGDSPVAMVFAREATPEVAQLIKKLEACAEKNKAQEMGACVIFCNDDSGLKAKLEEMAKKEGLKNCVLAIDNPAGPKDYEVSKDADVTVLLYKDHKVKANHTFRKGELNDKAVEKVVADLPKITTEKK